MSPRQKIATACCETALKDRMGQPAHTCVSAILVLRRGVVPKDEKLPRLERLRSELDWKGFHVHLKIQLHQALPSSNGFSYPSKVDKVSKSQARVILWQIDKSFRGLSAAFLNTPPSE